MAKLPRMKYNGQPVKTLKINGIEKFDCVDKNNIPWFHKHRGDAVNGGGCFTVYHSDPYQYQQTVTCGKTLEWDAGMLMEEPCNSSSSFYFYNGNWGCSNCGANWGASHPDVCTATKTTLGGYRCPEHGGKSKWGGQCGVSHTQTVTGYNNYFTMGCGFDPE